MDHSMAVLHKGLALEEASYIQGNQEEGSTDINSPNSEEVAFSHRNKASTVPTIADTRHGVYLLLLLLLLLLRFSFEPH